MTSSLTLHGWRGPRALSLLVGLGMAGAAALSVAHFYAASFPAAIHTGSFCDVNTFFDCDATAFGPLAQVAGVPLGALGLLVGALVVLGALFPSEGFERTNAGIALVNAVGVVALAGWSVAATRTICPCCAAYWLFSLVGAFLFWRRGAGRDTAPWGRFLRPSPLIVGVAALAAAGGAFGFSRLTAAGRWTAADDDAVRAVREYFALPRVALPSILSPYRSVSGTARFEDAPIQVVEYADFLCSDCLDLHRQLAVLRREFAGRLNIAFQPFPLEARCNAVVPKDKHPGACELMQIALAAGPERFPQVYDEIFAHFRQAKRPEWRAALARRLGVPGAPADTAVRATMLRLIETGREYASTSPRYPYGIRSTPTLIINGRMVIGTLPTTQLRAIFRALADPRAIPDSQRYLENWVP